MTKNEYISSWYNLFVQNVNGALGYIAAKMTTGNLPDECKDKLSIAKAFLEGKDVCDVERDLARKDVTDDTLEKTERIYVKIAEFFIDMTIKDHETKQVMMDFAHIYENYQKELTRLHMAYLRENDSHDICI